MLYKLRVMKIANGLNENEFENTCGTVGKVRKCSPSNSWFRRKLSRHCSLGKSNIRNTANLKLARSGTNTKYVSGTCLDIDTTKAYSNLKTNLFRIQVSYFSLKPGAWVSLLVRIFWFTSHL